MEAHSVSFEALEKALNQLKRALAQPWDEFVQDSVVQRFEFSFELAWKTLRRVLLLDRPLSDDSVRGIFREANQRGIIHDLDKWFAFHKARNLTSHTYNLTVASEVYAEAKSFVSLCDGLIQSMKARVQKDGTDA